MLPEELEMAKKMKKQFASQLICSYLSLNVILNYYRKCIEQEKEMQRNPTGKSTDVFS